MKTREESITDEERIYTISVRYRRTRINLSWTPMCGLRGINVYDASNDDDIEVAVNNDVFVDRLCNYTRMT